MTVERADVLVVGGGIVGLATAYQLLQRTPGLRLALIEREPAVAAHQSGHNSGVLHAGLYYAPGSLKAKLCREGKAELESFAEAHAIPFRHTGKLVVAVDESELARFEALRVRAEANGVPGLEVVAPERLREIEPHARGAARPVEPDDRDHRLPGGLPGPGRRDHDPRGHDRAWPCAHRRDRSRRRGHRSHQPRRSRHGRSDRLRRPLGGRGRGPHRRPRRTAHRALPG